MSQRLHVGLLECDHVRPHLRGISGDYADMFRQLFARHAPQLQLTGYDLVGGTMPADPREQDAWIITGSRHSVYDDLAWIRDLLAFIREVEEAGGTMVGICFGHQAIAHALGGEARPSERGWGLGVHTTGIACRRAWMEPPHDAVRLLMSHQDQVVAVPEGARVLAGSAHCDIALLEVDGRILGIQGHPEFTARYVAALMDERSDRIPQEVVAAARVTLDDRTDEATVARWIAAFIGQAVRHRDVA